MCEFGLQLMSKKRKLLRPPLTGSDKRNGMDKLPKEKKRSTSSEEFASVRQDISWQRRRLIGRKSIIASEGPPELVPIPSLMKVPNELGTYGAPDPWTTSNWP